MRPCEQLHAFIDGELPPEHRAAFLAHLTDCPACLRKVDELLNLEASFENAVAADSSASIESELRRRLRRQRALRLGIAVSAAAGLVAVVALLRPEPPARLAQLERRTIEARVGPPEMDRHAPYDPHLGGEAAPRPAYEELAELERRGRRMLTARLLQAGDTKAAAAVLDAARDDRSLDNERAVLALLEGRPQAALVYLPTDPRAPGATAQGLWNRALALRDLRLPHAEERAFEAVAARSEPGWSEEARRLGSAAKAQADRWQRRLDLIFEEGRALVAEQRPPSAATLVGQRDFVRLFFYDAVRSATGPAELDRLRPVAKALDQSYGGAILTSYLERVARTDFHVRGPLAARYRGYAVARWQDLDPKQLEGFLAELRRAGQPDMLIGALLATKAALDDVPEFTRLAKAQRDPWFSIAADEVAAEHPRLPLPEREALLKQAIANAAEQRFELRRLRLERILIGILLQQHRAQEALALLEELRERGRRLDDLTMERVALQNLVTVAHLRRERGLLRAYGEEVLLLPSYPCLNRRMAAIYLAEDAVRAGELEAARERLRQIPSCSDSTEVEFEVAAIYAELARRGGGRDTEALGAYLRSRVPARARAEQLLVSVLEQRARARTEPTAKAALTAAIAELETLSEEDEHRNQARLLAYRTLVLGAVEARDFGAALDLLVRERQTKMPPGCVLALGAEPGRMGIVARAASGEMAGALVPFAGEIPTPVLPPEIRARLAGCEEIAVVAEPVFHGHSRLLDHRVAWSFREGPAPLVSDPPGPFKHHLVVADVEPPRALKLERLPPWRMPPAPAVHHPLTGSAATPARVLASLGEADLVQFHTHGLMDARVADAALLVLSPSLSGDYALTAERIRQTKLAGRPLVILAACDAADIDLYYNPQWSLPGAFLGSGARGVFAATVKLPTEGARAFFAELAARLAGGQPPARALRDLRVAWAGRGEWVRDVLLFQ